MPEPVGDIAYRSVVEIVVRSGAIGRQKVFAVMPR
jgi:hypothetical protein